MTDIVERLRYEADVLRKEYSALVAAVSAPAQDAMRSAAETIERLRAQSDVLFASIKSNADEIERLRAANKLLQEELAVLWGNVKP